MSKKESTAKTYHHGDLRRQLLDEAVAILTEDGEQSLSMRHLAERTGVSRTAAYHYFANKDELLCAIAEAGFLRFLQAMHLLESGYWQANEASLLSFVQSYIRFATTQSQYYSLMFGGRLWKSTLLSDSLKKQAHAVFQQYVQLIKAWQCNGDVPAELDALRYAQVSWSTLHGMSRLLIDGIYLESAAVEAMAQQAAQLLWQPLRIE